MAYSESIPPRLIVGGGGIGGSLTAGGQIWLYVSADDDATVNGTDYFTNAAELGMRELDVVFVVDTTTPKVSVHYVSDVDADGNGTTAFAAVA